MVGFIGGLVVGVIVGYVWGSSQPVAAAGQRRAVPRTARRRREGSYHLETPQRQPILRGGSWPSGAKSTYLSEGTPIVETPAAPALFRGSPRGRRGAWKGTRSGYYGPENPEKPALFKGGSWPSGAKSTYISENPQAPALFRGQEEPVIV